MAIACGSEAYIEMKVKDMQILFICDRRKCENCWDGCELTSDPEHAAHFRIDDCGREQVLIETTAIERLIDGKWQRS